jgi:hypothetical protein
LFDLKIADNVHPNGQGYWHFCIEFDKYSEKNMKKVKRNPPNKLKALTSMTLFLMEGQNSHLIFLRVAFSTSSFMLLKSSTQGIWLEYFSIEGFKVYPCIFTGVVIGSFFFYS